MNEIRAFIAVPIDQKIRVAVKHIQDILKKTGCDVKWVNPQNLHLTLCFLGNIPEESLRGYYRAVQKSVSLSPSFKVSFQESGVFPGLNRPRVLWVGLNQGRKEITDLANNLYTFLGQASLPGSEKKERFSPHLTLGRVRSRMEHEKLMNVFKENKDFYGGDMEIGEIHFIRSVLTSRGPLYNTLKKFELD